jgi:hypothetical protein
MKPRTISAAVALASGLLFSNAQIVGVRADDRHRRGCSNKTLKGSYGSYRAGNGSMGPAASVGVITFDGNGNSSGLQNVSRNGTFILDNPTLGTYEVAEDCTGRFIDTMGNEVSRIVVVDDGNEFYGLSLTAGTAIYGVWKKIHTHDDGRDR